MRQNNKWYWLPLAVLGVGLSGCGGSDGDSDNSSSSTPPPVENQRVVTGAIQAIDGDTLKVNDLTFNQAGVKPEYAGSPLLEPLEVGMEVIVTATGTNAKQIEVNPLLTGQLKSAALKSSANWQVNGVPVNYKGAAPAEGDWVMVFGHYEQNGSVAASDLVQLSQQPTWIEVENRITALNESTTSFTLGSLSVNYGAAQIEDGPLVEGRWVEVHGHLNGNNLSAKQIDVEDWDEWPDSSELQGYVSYFNPVDGLLELDRQRQIWVTSATRFEGGSKADLQPGRLVEVEVANGNKAAEVELEGGSVPPSTGGGQFQLSGMANWHNERLTINDIEFTVDSMTRFEDGLTRDNLDGRWVSLEGMMQSGLNLVREIEPDEQDGSLDLQGQVAQGKLWGYRASDNSLASFEGQWADLDCHFDGNMVSNCRRDD